MLRPIRPEEIYDAAVDDEAFEHLAARVAESVGARSGVIHWRDPEGETEEISYSGYFTAGQMAIFEQEFSDCDLWSATVNRAENINRVWDCEDLISSDAYENSRIYNEWIRPMGDDTFRAMGGVIRAQEGIGEFGFHRGKSQGRFGEESVRALEAGLVHLRRMVLIRSKLAAAERLRASAAATLDVIGHAVFTLHAKGRLLHCNAAAEAVLRRGDGLRLRSQRLTAINPQDQGQLQAAIDRALAPDQMEASGILVHRQGGGGHYELSITSVGVGSGQRHVVIVLTDPGARDPSLQARLGALYGLTSAEAEVATRLSEGASLEALSQERGVALSTVRSQLKAISAKMGCRRQSELVAMISNLPRLRGLSIR